MDSVTTRCLGQRFVFFLLHQRPKPTKQAVVTVVGVAILACIAHLKTKRTSLFWERKIETLPPKKDSDGVFVEETREIEKPTRLKECLLMIEKIIKVMIRSYLLLNNYSTTEP